jgi:hypothetical protein
MSENGNVHWGAFSPEEKICKARESYVDLLGRGDVIGARSVMLSCYYGVMTGEPKLWKRYILQSLWHALILLCFHSEKMNHNQIDILLTFLLQTRRRGGWLARMIISINLIDNLAVSELRQAKERGEPHQIALAYMARAEICQLVKDLGDPTYWIEEATKLQIEIMQEEDRLQGLRQLVRIFKRAGVLYYEMGMYDETRFYLWLALDIAEKEANAHDQAMKIRSLMKKYKIAE